MPTFKFRGFQAASPVAISVAQGTAADSAGVLEWGMPVGNASFSITQLATGEVVAPYQALFEVDNASITGFDVGGKPAAQPYDPSAHDIVWKWTVTRPAGVAFTFSPTDLNIPTAWDDRNVVHGKFAAFVFDEPGDYVVSCTGTDSAGNTKTATLPPITVADEDAFYTGARTICLHPIGDTAEVPSGAIQVTTIAAAFAASYSTPDTTRIVLKRGAEYTFSDELYDQPNANATNFRIGSYGSDPARPILRFPAFDYTNTIIRTQFANKARYDHQCFHDLDIRGSYDSTTETGYAPTGMRLDDSPTPILVHKCRFDGVGYAATAGNNQPDPSFVTISEIEVTNSRVYQYFMNENLANGSRLSFLGCRMHHSEQALNGTKSAAFNKLGNQSGIVRITYHPNVLMVGCSLYSRVGNTPTSSPGVAEGAKANVAIGPCARLLTAGNKRGNYDPDHPAYGFFDRCTMEGGSESSMRFRGENSGTEEIPVNYVIDKCLFVGHVGNGWMIEQDYTGTTWRNNYFYKSNYDAGLQGPDFRGVFEFEVNNPANGSDAQPVRIYNNTILLESDPAKNNGRTPVFENGGSSLFSDYTAENNVFHLPNAAPAVEPDAPLGTSALAGYSPLWKGWRWHATDVIEHVHAQDIPQGNTVIVPYPALRNGYQSKQSDFDDPGNDFHMLYHGPDSTQIDGVSKTRYSEKGHFSVAFNAEGFVVTNNTAVTWQTGWKLEFKPDIKATLLMALDPTSASPTTIPAPAPQAGSNALQGANNGMVAERDFYGQPRPTPPSRGAFEVAN